MDTMYTTGPWTNVFLDYETQSECDLKACGSYVYASHPTTKVICAAIMINGHRIFWTMDKFNVGMPHGIEYAYGCDFIRQLFESPIIAIAHNVDFERPITRRTLGLPDPLGGWRDTADQTLMRGLPGGADAAGQYLFGMGKDLEGYSLMMKTCKPDRHGVMPPITDDIIRRYVIYNFRDVEIQYGISERFGVNISPPREQQVNDLHRAINHRGVQVDTEFAQTLRSFDEAFKNEARRQVEVDTHGVVKGKDLTRNDFLRAYLKTQNLEMDNMRADQIESILEADEDGEIELSTEIYSVLTNRLVVSRAALAKVETAIRRTCADGRIYALLKYWGARTGRWSSLGLQLQNMRKPNEDFDLEAAVQAIEDKNIETFQVLCQGHRPYELLSSLVRGILIPRPGCKFVVGDFSQIEARVLLWLAEDWTNLQGHVDYDLGLGPNIYCLAAEAVYQRPIRKATDPVEYGIGKISELACGYQGGVGAVNRFAYSAGVDLVASGISPQTLVDGWRSKHPLVVDAWHFCDEAFRRSLRNPGKEYISARCAFVTWPGYTEIRLPSGRKLTYMNARLEESRRAGWEGSTVIVYDSAVKGRVKREEIYGGKIVENITQAVARDLLADAMIRIDETGDEIVMHVHDEVVVEAPEDCVEEVRQSVEDIMKVAPDWAKGVPVNAKPEVMLRYGK